MSLVMHRNWILVLILVFLALQFFIIRHAQAEYRVYRLGIKYDDKQKTETEIITTLDNLQYETYYKLTATQTTRLIDHWMCRGHTDNFKHYCSKPQARATASNSQGTGTLPMAVPPTVAPRSASAALAQSPNDQSLNQTSKPPTAAQNAVPIVIQ